MTLFVGSRRALSAFFLPAAYEARARVLASRMRRVWLLGTVALIASTAATQHAAATTPAPVVTFNAVPRDVSSGGSSTLAWSATNATSCTASNAWSGSKAVSGSFSTGALKAETKYTLVCTGAGGSDAVSATVYMVDQVPVVSLTAQPSKIAAGGSATLSWSATYSESCHGRGGDGGWDVAEPVSGKATTGSLTGTTSFILDCFNASGAKTSVKTTVTVTGAVSATTGTASLSWNAPTTNTNGTPVTPLSGYTIYYGTSEGSMTRTLTLSGSSTTSCEISGLSEGTWYFAIAANATDGTSSAQSNIGSLTI
jgi:Fibronectin type III domain